MLTYLFDVDGTLTPACQAMDPDFKDFFINWSLNKQVILVTGSDKEKTIKQIGEDLWSISTIFQCAGNELYINGEEIYSEPLASEWDEYYNMTQYLESWISGNSKWPVAMRFNNRFEVRKGMFNFSNIGRDCSLEDRNKYFVWDTINQERNRLCQYMAKYFTDYEFHAGGQISIDIYPKGKTKAQVLDYSIIDKNNVLFFADKVQSPGNDYVIAKELPEKNVIQVNSYQDTWNYLKSI